MKDGVPVAAKLVSERADATREAARGSERRWVVLVWVVDGGVLVL
jgi:hypothetical protein